MTEDNTISSHSQEKQKSLKVSTSKNDAKTAPENNGGTYVFVNHATVVWHESRNIWVGDKSKRSQKIPKDPIISWSMTYEDLLSTHEPFPEPIPLPEMVDFLVDIWHDDGLYD
jgi:hypothetical protein